VVRACNKCGVVKNTGHNLSCAACRSRERWRNAPPARCHPERKEMARGMCSMCYRQEIRPRASCHPAKPAAADGLCNLCYSRLPSSIERARVTRRAAKYGMTAETFEAMAASQNGVCAVCKEREFDHVDHDHESGSVRGLLCRQCNVGIGFFQDSPELLAKAIKYLEAA
jgi:hypothetical protein